MVVIFQDLAILDETAMVLLDPLGGPCAVRLG
jgi:hypothetical protein